MQVERRFNAAGTAGVVIEQRATGRVVRGLAAAYYNPQDVGTQYELWPSAYERIKAGAFTNAIKTADVRLLQDHNPSLILGRNRAGTMKLWEDARGLWFEGQLPPSPIGENVAVALGRGDISGCSFAFGVEDGGETWTQEGPLAIRTLTALQLFDVSVVSYPAYQSTTATLADSDTAPTRDAQLVARQRATRARRIRCLEIDADLLRL